MGPFKSIALLGKGHLGSAVIEQLASSGFEVTVLSRNSALVKDVPQGVRIAQVDYTSIESLTTALSGQDVVIATFGEEAIPLQKGIIDASISAGVKRYIPADWGTLTTDPKARNLPINYPYIQIQDYLKEKAEKGELEYTIFSVGAFLDYVLDFPFILDLATHSIQIYDDGQNGFSSTSLVGISKAVSGALKRPETTRNRNLFIHETVLTQAKVLALAKKCSPPGTEWTETRLNADEELDRALQIIKRYPLDLKLRFPVLKASLLGGKFTAGYSKVDNEIVGLSVLSDEELEKRFAKKFRH